MPDDGQRNGMHMRKARIASEVGDSEALWTFFEKTMNSVQSTIWQCLVRILTYIVNF
jgi:hypothetical protein